MDMKRKIVLIGAGSAVFTQGLLSDIIQDSKEFSWTISLCDIDPVALESVTGLCRKMVAAKQADIQIQSAVDRREVLSGADYVVATIGVGGRRAWENDVFIPRKYGIYQPVGDTVMPGGISRAMRMIPAMVDIAEDVKELCPDAVFINYSNPMTAICRGIRKQTGVNVIGLCHGVPHTERVMASICDFDIKHVTTRYCGLNHLTYFYDFRYKGKDAFPVLKQRADRMEPFTREIFESYGVFLAPGDRHIVEFFPERFGSGAYYGKTLGVDAFSFEDTIAGGDKTYEETVRLGNSDQPLPQSFFAKLEGEHEQLIAIIRSLEFGEQRIFPVNVPNDGMTAALPPYAVLEMPAVICGSGVIPLKIGTLPSAAIASLARHTALVETVVDAALQGSRELFLQAILMGGYMTDYSKAKDMVDELITAQKAYLPQF